MHSNSHSSLWGTNSQRESGLGPVPAIVLTGDYDVSSVTVYISRLLGFQKPSWLKKFVCWYLCVWLCLSILFFSLLINSTTSLLNSPFGNDLQVSLSFFLLQMVKNCLQRGSSSPLNGIHKHSTLRSKKRWLEIESIFQRTSFMYQADDQVLGH